METNKDPILNTFTPESLSASLRINVNSLMRKMYRMGLKYSRHEDLPTSVVEEIIEEYSKPHPQRSDEVIEQAQNIAQQVNVQINIERDTIHEPTRIATVPTVDEQSLSLNSDSSDSVTTVSDKTPTYNDSERTVSDSTPTSGKRITNVLAYLAFVFILAYQMEHVASIATDVSTFEGDTARQVSGWLFAFTFCLTALIMTIKRGIQAKIKVFKREMSYILLFALLDLVFFVISAAPLESINNSLLWCKALLVGSATAFVIYSFNELVTDR